MTTPVRYRPKHTCVEGKPLCFNCDEDINPTMQCSKCKTILGTPYKLFYWSCVDCGKQIE